MGFQMVCDICGRTMKNVKANELKKTVENNQDIECGVCKRRIKDAQNAIERIKKDASNDFEQLAKRYKDLIMLEIKNGGDDGEDTQDVGG